MKAHCRAILFLFIFSTLFSINSRATSNDQECGEAMLAVADALLADLACADDDIDCILKANRKLDSACRRMRQNCDVSPVTNPVNHHLYRESCNIYL